jgi:hypothetical protein
VVTNDAELAESVRVLRDYGQRQKSDHVVKGFNRRLDNLQAAFLRIKLRHLDGWNDQRRQHAASYAALLDDSGLSLPTVLDHVESVWHLFVVRSDGRDALREYLAERGIQTGIHYPVPIHLQTAYADLGLSEGSFPVTEGHAEQMVSLPMFPELTRPQLEHVADTLREHVARSAPAPARRGGREAGLRADATRRRDARSHSGRRFCADVRHLWRSPARQGRSRRCQRDGRPCSRRSFTGGLMTTACTWKDRLRWAPAD